MLCTNRDELLMPRLIAVIAIVALTTAIPQVATSAESVCVNSQTGKMLIRAKCKKAEFALNIDKLKELGIEGPTGPAGPTGPPGPPGSSSSDAPPVSDSDPAAAQRLVRAHAKMIDLGPYSTRTVEERLPSAQSYARELAAIAVGNEPAKAELLQFIVSFLSEARSFWGGSAPYAKAANDMIGILEPLDDVTADYTALMVLAELQAPEAWLATARDALQKDIARAKAGSVEAANMIPRIVDRYLEAAKKYAPSAYPSYVSQVTADLSSI